MLTFKFKNVLVIVHVDTLLTHSDKEQYSFH